MVLGAGGLALAVSVVIAASLPLRGVDFNVLNAWTLLLGAVGGVLALTAKSKGWVVGALAFLVLAALPALFGWVGWLYLPSIVLLSIALARSKV